MTYVDSTILDLTERMCRRFQMWTGRTNVWLAFQLTNLSIVVYFIWVAGLYWLSGTFAARLFVALFCSGVFFLLTRTIFKTSIEASESEAYRRLAKGLRNPRRIRDAQLRIAFLTLSVVLAFPLWLAYVTLHLGFILLTGALIFLTTVVLYMLACDPLPPCAGTLPAWRRWMAPARDANAPSSSTATTRAPVRQGEFEMVAAPSPSRFTAPLCGRNVFPELDAQRRRCRHGQRAIHRRSDPSESAQRTRDIARWSISVSINASARTPTTSGSSAQPMR